MVWQGCYGGWVSQDHLAGKGVHGRLDMILGFGAVGGVFAGNLPALLLIKGFFSRLGFNNHTRIILCIFVDGRFGCVLDTQLLFVVILVIFKTQYSVSIFTAKKSRVSSDQPFPARSMLQLD